MRGRAEAEAEEEEGRRAEGRGEGDGGGGHHLLSLTGFSRGVETVVIALSWL